MFVNDLADLASPTPTNISCKEVPNPHDRKQNPECFFHGHLAKAIAGALFFALAPAALALAHKRRNMSCSFCSFHPAGRDC